MAIVITRTLHDPATGSVTQDLRIEITDDDWSVTDETTAEVTTGKLAPTSPFKGKEGVR